MKDKKAKETQLMKTEKITFGHTSGISETTGVKEIPIILEYLKGIE